MKILDQFLNYHFESPLSLLLGNFDGFHAGHLQNIETLIVYSKKTTTQSVLLFFDPPTRTLKDPFQNYLMTSSEKIEILKNFALDYVVVHPLKTFPLNWSAANFLKKLSEKGVRTLFLGFNQSIGSDQISAQNLVIEKTPVKIKKLSKWPSDLALSSSFLRDLLENGKIEEVNRRIYRPYKFSAKVVCGQGIGRKIGFPTANLEVTDLYKMLPKRGVYVAYTFYQGEKKWGLMNIGYRPTVNQEKKLSLEIHLLDLQKDLYGEEMDFFLIKRLRDEKKFNNLEELRTQIALDILALKTWLG